MRKAVNNFLSVALVFGFSFLYNSCENDNLKRAIGREEKINTCNCSTLVSMKPYEHNSWLFETQRNLIIRNPFKPKLIIGLIKADKNTDSTSADIILSVKIDSAMCVDEGSYVFFVFKDSTKFALENFYGDNCNGNNLASFKQNRNNIAGVKNVVDLKKVCNVKISYIRIMTHDGYQDYDLSDIEAANFMHLFKCIYEAK